MDDGDRATSARGAFRADGGLEAAARRPFANVDPATAGGRLADLLEGAATLEGVARERAAQALFSVLAEYQGRFELDERRLIEALERLDAGDPVADVYRFVMRRWFAVAANGGGGGFESAPATSAPPPTVGSAPPPIGAAVSPTEEGERGGASLRRRGGGQRSKPPEVPPPDAGSLGPVDAGGGAAAPHRAYGLLRAPAEVVALEPFTLAVGLSQRPAEGVAGTSFDLPPLDIQPYVVDVRIAAAGFTFPRGQKRRRALEVSAGDPFPTVEVRLVPKKQADPTIQRRITAEYSIGGERLGDAIRSIRVLRSADLRTVPSETQSESGVNVPAPTGESVADLTITVREGDRPGYYDWTFDSPHKDEIPASTTPSSRKVGDPAEFLKSRIREIDEAEGDRGIFRNVLGIARTIAAAVPNDVWGAIHAAAAKVDGPPSILLVSEDPYVPWELAWVGAPLPDPSAPPFLSAQARIGRWVQAVEQADGRSRPAPNPPRRKDVESLRVIWGDYSETDWANLDHAKKEGQLLERNYGATRIPPSSREMYDLLGGNPRSDLLHFAVHGLYGSDPGGEDGIILTDGTLHPDEVLAVDLEAAPVVFLNACQVAAGRRALGTYSGVAAAFIKAGASAVVAPLWSIDDEIAGSIAVDFYEQAAAGDPLSEVLRQSRKAFVDSFDTKSATWMAYQLFAHPSFVIGGLKKR